MKVTLKNLQQQTFTIEIDDSKTILELKQAIAAEKGADYAVENQKLIYAGKILTDDATVAASGIEESKFIVVMLTKPKPGSAAASAEPAKQPATAVKTTESASSSETTATATTPAAVSQDTTTSASTESTPAQGLNIASAESNLVLGADYEATISRLMDMGYPRSDVERAMRASFNNPDRAVEYLISGIPETEQEPPVSVEERRGPAAAPAAQQQQPAGVGGVGGVGGIGGGVNPLEFLRSQPQFQQMREVIRQNPNLLSTVMQQIGATNPELLRLITENQQAFVEMLNQDAALAEASMPGGPIAGGGGPDLSSFMGTATITQADKEAIERLKALGFAEYLVVQAYFACNKDENMAADFLLSQGDDD